jgi:transcription elongation factor
MYVQTYTGEQRGRKKTAMEQKKQVQGIQTQKEKEINIRSNCLAKV